MTATQPTHVLGLIFDTNSSKILLIRKNRPTFMKGLLNGIGGKIEQGETPIAAISRETEEETALVIPTKNWTHTGMYFSASGSFNIVIYKTIANISLAKSMTDEQVTIENLNSILSSPEISAESLPALITLSLNNPQSFPFLLRNNY